MPDVDAIESREEGQLREALESMVHQFAYWTTDHGGAYWTGGLSALEEAFEALGWTDPQPAPEWARCDEPGCTRQRTCGIPTPVGYRKVCGDHYHALALAR